MAGTMLDVLNTALGAAGGVIGTLILRRGQGRDSDRQIDARLEEHRDGLIFDLLETAKKERATMQAQLERWQAIAAHLADFDLALVHIEAPLAAETQQERAAVERSARAFLGRVEVKRRAQQQVRAEAQIGVSAANLNEDAKKGS